MRLIYRVMIALWIAGAMNIGGRAQAPVRELDNEIEALSGEIAGQLQAQQIRKLCVIDFADLDGQMTDLGKFVAEELVTRLLSGGQFQVRERLRVNQALQQQGIYTGNVIDAQQAIQIGRLLGVEVLVTGTIANLAEEVKINVRIFSARDGSLLAAAQGALVKDHSIRMLLKEVSTSVTSGGGQAHYDFGNETFLEDRFEGEILNPAWTANRGEWLLVEGTLAQNDRNVFSMIVCQIDWLGYEMHLRAQKIDGEEGFVIGIKLREDGETLVWNIGANGNQISVLQTYLDLMSVSGNTVKYRHLPGTEKPVAIAAGKWYDIRVVIRGPNLRCYLDDEMMIHIKDPVIQKYGRGKIFLGTYLTRAYFDDVVIFGSEG